LKTLGRHAIAEFYDCSQERLEDLGFIRGLMLATAEHIGATIVGESFHTFSPQGVSGVVIIAESHLSIHTWPENGYAAVDIYTCGGLNPRVGCDYLAEHLQAQDTRLQEVIRGLPEETERQQIFSPEGVRVVSQILPTSHAAGRLVSEGEIGSL
jgi:S-adenosylmethionine decarboxylase